MALITEEINAMIVYGRKLARREFDEVADIQAFAQTVEGLAPGAGSFIYCGVGEKLGDYPFTEVCVLGHLVESFYEDEHVIVEPDTWRDQGMYPELWSGAEQEAQFTDDGPGWYLCVTGWGWVRLLAIEGEDAPPGDLPYSDAELGDTASRIGEDVLSYLRAHPVKTQVSYC